MLCLHVKFKFYEMIDDDLKSTEYRLCNKYWYLRLRYFNFGDVFRIYKGYTKEFVTVKYSGKTIIPFAKLPNYAKEFFGEYATHLSFYEIRFFKPRFDIEE